MDTPTKPRAKLSPILGLPIDDDPLPPTREAPSATTSDDPAPLQLSVIIPVRNEAYNLPACLDSLVAQTSDLFLLNRDWELLVIDDASTDDTRAIAAAYPGVRVLEAPPLELRATQRAFTGKTNACWLGAQQSLGRHLLFTDADTIHEPNNLIHALGEARKYNAALLSYSPRQIVTGLAQHAVMPLIFSELVAVYPPAQVNDPDKRLAAANGQFILVDRAAYFAVGGHRAVGRSVLEDVDLAFNIKRSKRILRFRYAPDALSTRMYLDFPSMFEGWTKNLALLFPHALALAAWRFLDVLLFLLPLVLIPLHYLVLWQQSIILIIWIRTLFRFYSRVAASHFSPLDVAISPFALPLFITLLLRSWMDHKLFHRIAWKGREYRTGR